MVEICRADDFGFFKPFIDKGMLTVGQMHHAADRYYLGKTRSGSAIFWMIDEKLYPWEARIVRPDSSETWMSTLLKAREPLIEWWEPLHCLFGLHLLTNPVRNSVNPRYRNSALLPVSIVESEQSAVILSELFPESIWMAYVNEMFLDMDLFAPLEGRKVIIYPRTDPTLTNYLFFEDLASTVRKRYPTIHIKVSTILEDNATDEQKSHCIDLVDLLINPLRG